MADRCAALDPAVRRIGCLASHLPRRAGWRCPAGTEEGAPIRGDRERDSPPGLSNYGRQSSSQLSSQSGHAAFTHGVDPAQAPSTTSIEVEMAVTAAAPASTVFRQFRPAMRAAQSLAWSTNRANMFAHVRRKPPTATRKWHPKRHPDARYSAPAISSNSPQQYEIIGKNLGRRSKPGTNPLWAPVGRQVVVDEEMVA